MSEVKVFALAVVVLVVVSNAGSEHVPRQLVPTGGAPGRPGGVSGGSGGLGGVGGGSGGGGGGGGGHGGSGGLGGGRPGRPGLPGTVDDFDDDFSVSDFQSLLKEGINLGGVSPPPLNQRKTIKIEPECQNISTVTEFVSQEQPKKKEDWVDLLHKLQESGNHSCAISLAIQLLSAKSLLKERTSRSVFSLAKDVIVESECKNIPVVTDFISAKKTKTKDDFINLLKQLKKSGYHSCALSLAKQFLPAAEILKLFN